MAHPNEELIRSGYDAFNRRDVATIMSLLADDVVFHIPGHSQQSGDFSGKNGAGASFRRSESYPEAPIGWRSMTYWPTMHAVALLRAKAERDDKTFDMNVAHVWHVRQGKAAELWILPGDQYAFDEFWS